MSGDKPKKDVTEAVMGALDQTDEWEKQQDEEEAERQASRLESAFRRAASRPPDLP
jgi:hypothetical protein